MTPFQINSIVDASAPFYGQLVKAEGKENENVSVTATQGTQTWVKVAYLLYLTFLKARVISPALIIHTCMCTVYILWKTFDVKFTFTCIAVHTRNMCNHECYVFRLHVHCDSIEQHIPNIRLLRYHQHHTPTCSSPYNTYNVIM